MTKPSIFIGSSSEALDFPRAVQEQLSSDAEVTIWNELPFFPGQFTIETLLNNLKRFDFAVFVFSPDDKVTSRGSTSTATRDNVVFELGLFMGHLGRERAFVLLQKNANVKLLSDLHGLTAVEYEWPNSDRNELSAVGAACNKMRRAIRDLGIFSGNERQLALVTNEVQELGDKSEKLKNEVIQQGEQLAQQQKTINGLVEYAMSASIFRHLCGIALLKTYDLDFHDTNKRELYFLRDHGFIQPRYGGFLDFSEGRHNVANMAEPTPIGTAYVRIRKQEIPPEMRSDPDNLRVDISTL
jgi:hypothetical protein